MNKQEKMILKKVIDSNEGLLSPALLINSIAERDQKSVENLVVMGYLEEVPRELQNNHHGYYTVNFYRVTEKGLLMFAPFLKKAWVFLQKDIRTVLIAVVTAITTSIITVYVQKILE